MAIPPAAVTFGEGLNRIPEEQIPLPLDPSF
jgi:hypothetical protein